MSYADRQLINQVRGNLECMYSPSMGMGRRIKRHNGKGKRSVRKQNVMYVDPINLLPDQSDYYVKNYNYMDNQEPPQPKLLTSKRLMPVKVNHYYDPDSGQNVPVYTPVNIKEKYYRKTPKNVKYMNQFGEIKDKTLYVPKKDTDLDTLLKAALLEIIPDAKDTQAYKNIKADIIDGNGRRRRGRGILINGDGRRRRGRGTVGGRKNKLSAYQKHMKHHMGHGMCMEDAAALWSGSSGAGRKRRKGHGRKIKLSAYQKHMKHHMGHGMCMEDAAALWSGSSGAGATAGRQRRRGRGGMLMSANDMNNHISNLARQSYY